MSPSNNGEELYQYSPITPTLVTKSQSANPSNSLINILQKSIREIRHKMQQDHEQGFRVNGQILERDKGMEGRSTKELCKRVFKDDGDGCSTLCLLPT